MTELGESNSESELDDPNKIADAEACLDYLKRREVFLYKMMNDPSHKAMLYFLEVLMNSEAPVTVEQLAARFSHKTFSPEMREACGGGDPNGLREFLQRYPSLFNIRANGQVTSVAIELPTLESMSDELDGCANGVSLRDLQCSRMNSGNSVSSIRTSKSGTDRRQNRHSLNAIDANGKHKPKCGSTLSLLSTPSVTSNGSSNSSCTHNRHVNGDTNGSSKYRLDRISSTFSDRSNRSGQLADVQSSSNHHRPSNPTTAGNCQRSSNIYQPPHIRELARLSNTATASCELCSAGSGTTDNHTISQQHFAHADTAAALANHHCATTASTTCTLHCPLLDLAACHHTHHCSTTHHSHPCPCSANSACTVTQHCLHCHPVHSLPSVIPRPALLPSKYCILPPMDKLILETEAVRFFQQRLLKREERWVPIKSLAGHLSQASSEVRAVVGPQLEFRNFLLKHPHVFEVQGELVSVKNPFSGAFPQRRLRDRPTALHASLSSSNLSVQESNLSAVPIRAQQLGRPNRPKSLVLSASNAADPFTLEAVFNDQNLTNKRFNENRRSTHFANNFTVGSQLNPVVNINSFAASIGSNPATPTVPGSAAQLTSQRTSLSSVGGTVLSRPSQSHGLQSQKVSSASQSDINRSTSCNDLTNRNSISISMSANEYRAVMFLRRALEKKGPQPVEQAGMKLTELMRILSTKASEAVQNTIGWTEVELEEFARQHSIFFDLLQSTFNTEGQSSANLPIPVRPSQTNDSSILIVNKKLQRMINIVIISTKPSDENIRMLTNQSGRVFHVAKLWGIIDLGGHEHVFFDKSIFKHVDDLQRHFKVDEVLYFNAILAPKESRAKWRATQVWKECDRENVEKLGGNSGVSVTRSYAADPVVSEDNTLADIDFNPMASIDSSISMSTSTSDVDFSLSRVVTSAKHEEGSRDEKNASEGSVNQSTSLTHTATTNGKSAEQGAEGAQQVSTVDCISNGLMTKSMPSASMDDSDCEVELDEDEPFLEALARQEGLHLARDVRVLAADVDVKSQSGWQAEVDGSECVTSTCPSNHYSSQPTKADTYETVQAGDVSVASSGADNSERFNDHVSSSTGKHHGKGGKKPVGPEACENKNTRNHAEALSESANVSIAVQTLSTGDIMATQLYHDQLKQTSLKK